RLPPCRISQGGQNAMERKRGERLPRQRPADALDNNIYAAAPRDPSDAISETLCREIDDIGKPKGPCLRGLGRVGRGRNRLPRALRSGQLGNRIADRTTDRRRQHGLARLEARLRESNLRRQIGHRHTSGGGILDVVGDPAEIFAAHGDPFAVGAVFRDTVRTGQHDPGPQCKRRVTRLLHHTRSLVPQYQRRRRWWVAARKYGVVQRGDAGCGDPDQDPPLSQTRSWYLYQLQACVPRERLGAYGSHHDFSFLCHATAASAICTTTAGGPAAPRWSEERARSAAH